MSYEVYKVLHVAAIMAMFASLGGLAVIGSLADANPQLRKLFSIAHGVSLLIVLVAGFGLLARLGVSGGFPGWVYLKLAIWLVLGGSLVALKRLHRSEMVLWALPAIGALAAGIAIYKPFA